jgi:hypothetical protein
MRKRTRIIIGGLTVALALAAGVSTATARRFEVSEQRFLILFSELSLVSGVTILACSPLTIEGSFHSRTISKLSGQLIGHITEATFHNGECGGFLVWMLNGVEIQQNGTVRNTLPWHVLYKGFEGVLPSIRGIELSIINMQFGLNNSGFLCLYQTESRRWLEFHVFLERGTATEVRVSEERAIPLMEGGIVCPTSLSFRGRGAIGTQGRWAAISVRLVE